MSVNLIDSQIYNKVYNTILNLIAVNKRTPYIKVPVSILNNVDKFIFSLQKANLKAFNKSNFDYAFYPLCLKPDLKEIIKFVQLYKYLLEIAYNIDEDVEGLDELINSLAHYIILTSKDYQDLI